LELCLAPAKVSADTERMAFDASLFAPRTQEDIDQSARHHRARLGAESDRRFFMLVARSNESVTASLKSSAAKVAESRALLDTIDSLLRR
jgi:hypothetical protein